MAPRISALTHWDALLTEFCRECSSIALFYTFSSAALVHVVRTFRVAHIVLHILADVACCFATFYFRIKLVRRTKTLARVTARRHALAGELVCKPEAYLQAVDNTLLLVRVLLAFRPAVHLSI